MVVFLSDDYQARGYAEGTKDRFEGKKDSVMGAVWGDTDRQTTGNAQKEYGRAQQDFNKNY